MQFWRRQKKEFADAGHKIRVKDIYSQEAFKTTLDAVDFGQIMNNKIPTISKESKEMLLGLRLSYLFIPFGGMDNQPFLRAGLTESFCMVLLMNTLRKGLKGCCLTKKALVVQTTGGDEKSYIVRDSKDVIEKSITDGILRFCGINEIIYKVFFAVPTVSDSKRNAMLEEVIKLIKNF